MHTDAGPIGPWVRLYRPGRRYQSDSVRPLLIVLVVASIGLGQVMLSNGPALAGDVRIEVQDVSYVPISADLAAYPAPESWQKISKPTVSVLLLNSSFSPRFEASFIKIDGQSYDLFWNSSNRTITIYPRDLLADGPHRVSVYLEDAQIHAILAEWTFHQDTVTPIVLLDALPFAADKRVYTINGTVLEPNLARVDVNGYSALVDGERFLVPVLLWPGHNDLLVTAIDRAGNVGYGEGEMSWLPPGPADVEYAPIVHPNASFIVRFPTTWEVKVDQELEPGFRADAAALEPESVVYLRSSITVVSRLAGQGMNQGLFLGIMQNAIAQISEQSQVTIVSRPRLIGSVDGPATVRFSLVDLSLDGQRIFRHVTGFWSKSVGRIWIVIGSVAVEKVETQWYALQTAADTFQVIEPERPPAGGEPPQAGIDRALLVTTAGILLIITIFTASLYSIRRRGRRYPFRR